MQVNGLLRLPQVLAMVGLSKSTLYRKVKAGLFPAPIKLSANLVVWKQEVVMEWIASL
tara:strand:+ start:196 stop:369 length:174 start_codon:yes stop_codon:yes gene_type:complete